MSVFVYSYLNYLMNFIHTNLFVYIVTFSNVIFNNLYEKYAFSIH